MVNLESLESQLVGVSLKLERLGSKLVYERKKVPSHEIIALFVLRKLILQTHMRSHPVGLDV